MKTNYHLIFMCVIALLFSQSVIAGDQIPKDEFRPGIAVFKVEPELKADLLEGGSDVFGIAHIDEFLSQISMEKVERMFPDCLPPKPDGTDLSLIYTIYFPITVDVMDVCNDLKRLSGIVYADPWWLPRYSLEHNDPQRNNQYGLNLCDANDAHDISTGNSDAIVAIVDSGIDMEHSDLLPNMWVNLGEDANGDGQLDEDDENGQDDDRNGKTDDFWGWDFMDRDGYPHDSDRSGWRGHGTHCAGISSAKTNNRTGIASVGYNCTVLPIRTGSEGTVTYGYQGIEYAVRAGASVISCSWGSYQNAGFARDVINSAYENDVLVLCAAGNDNTDNLHYPSAYDNCVAVAATGSNDVKANFSNYGEYIDISAPGVNIRSTFLGNTYRDMSGTSMACPFAAGVAILIRATVPDADVDEVWELLIEGADDISGVNQNRYEGLLGSGRINAYNSLMMAQRPMPEIEEFEIIADGDGNGALDPGEEVEVVIAVNNNFGRITAEDVTITLTSSDPTIHIEGTGNVAIGDIEPGEGSNNEDSPFVVTVNDDAIDHTTYFDVIVIVQPRNITVTKRFELVIGHPDILIVDDDNGEEIEDWYFNTVEGMEQGWVRWSIAENDEVDPNDVADLMLDHKMVIWATGNDEEPLSEIDRWTISAAILDGASVLLIGNRIGNDEENHDMLEEFFGTAHVADSAARALMVTGLPSKPVDETMMTNFFINPEKRQSPSTMEAIDGADSLMVYLRRPGDDQGLAAVYRESDFGEGRTAYIGFTFETLSTTPTEPSIILNQIYQWMIGEWEEPNTVPTDGNLPYIFSMDPAFPNPFNSTLQLSYSLPMQADYSLAIYDASGRQAAMIDRGNAPAGQYKVEWNAVGIPSGVYFLQLESIGQKSLSQKITLIK